MEYSHSILVNSLWAISGDADSVAIIFNNLIGVNSLDNLAQYREYMGTEMLDNPTAFADNAVVTVVNTIDGRKIAQYQIGDKDPVRMSTREVMAPNRGVPHLGENYPAEIVSKYHRWIEATRPPLKRFCEPFVRKKSASTPSRRTNCSCSSSPAKGGQPLMLPSSLQTLWTCRGRYLRAKSSILRPARFGWRNNRTLSLFAIAFIVDLLTLIY
jgi:hypothetical protein